MDAEESFRFGAVIQGLDDARKTFDELVATADPVELLTRVQALKKAQLERIVVERVLVERARMRER